ncbi:corrinoid protein [bacterium]|nr:corrinoid protein [bacterium]
MTTDESVLRQIQNFIINGDNESLNKLVRKQLKKGMSASNILYDGMIPAMDHIGTEFKFNRIFIPEVLLSARAMNDGLILLEPHLSQRRSALRHRILIGTIHGDMHDIGKNLVAIMLKGAGFEILDLGFNVPVETYIEKMREYQPEIVCLSSLLTTAMPGMKTVIDEMEQNGIRQKIKVLVGGAPVSQRFADNIGADGYADDAIQAVDLAKNLLKI